MNPAAGVPLHFTVEALGLGVAGVILAWAVLARRWAIASGALLLGVAQVLYAGQFFDPNGTGAVVTGGLRLAGVVVLGIAGIAESDAPLLLGAPMVAGASVLLLGATAWRMADSAGPASLSWGQRGPEILGFVFLAIWAWRRASTSVRSRIVAAFLAVLGAAVVVMGGAAARVSVTNALDNAQTRLDSSARDAQRLLDARATDLLNRGALGSAIVTQLGPSAATLATLRPQAFPDVDVLAIVRASGQPLGTADAAVAGSAPVRAALAGRGATGVVTNGPGGAIVVAAQPVLPRTAGAALVVGSRLDEGELGTLAAPTPAAATAELLTDTGVVVRSGRAAPAVPFALVQSQSTASGRLDLHGTDVLVSAVRLQFSSPPPAALAFVLPVSAAVDVATAFPRALVGGVLVAALLAVVLALWLASRITRPILSLADEAERVKSDFLATISHELRTPLTPIRGYTDLLRRGRVPRRRAEVYLDEIGEAAGRMERIVTLLVEVAAIEAGRFTLDREPLAPAELLSRVVERWTRRAPRHRFATQAGTSLPRVATDERAITRVLDELVDNAVKFSPDGGTIELRARRVGDGVELSVADEGIGLEADTLHRLSSAFVQAEPGETRRFGGLGLGLTYAAGVLSAHGTHLEVEGTKDAGATFSFTLPGMVSRMAGRTRRDDDVTT